MTVSKVRKAMITPHCADRSPHFLQLNEIFHHEQFQKLEGSWRD